MVLTAGAHDGQCKPSNELRQPLLGSDASAHRHGSTSKSAIPQTNPACCFNPITRSRSHGWGHSETAVWFVSKTAGTRREDVDPSWHTRRAEGVDSITVGWPSSGGW